MKKEYKKPFLAIESFQLDAAIAATCSSMDGEAIHYGIDNCADNALDFGYAFTDACDVDVTTGTGDANDKICYHGPTLTGGIVYIYS